MGCLGSMGEGVDVDVDVGHFWKGDGAKEC